MLMPETVMLSHKWPLSEKAQAELDDKKRKPSKEIRIDAMREAIEFSQRTSAWGRGKVVALFPAERMNHITANALLKTLEEPSGDVKFVLASEAAHMLLPTIRSRCQLHAMQWPPRDDSVAWLQAHGVEARAASVLLRASGGRPEDALLLFQKGRDPLLWSGLPRAVQRGDVAVLRDWGAAEVVDALHKLCHDMQLVQQGAAPRFFAAADLPVPAPLRTLSAWGRELANATRTMEHPFNPGLLQEALFSQAQSALNSSY